MEARTINPGPGVGERTRLSPLALNGWSSRQNGPKRLAWVSVAPSLPLLSRQTSADTPSEPAINTTSLCDGVVFWPIAATIRTASWNSRSVRRTSRTKPCRCRTSASNISRSRGSSMRLTASMTASVTMAWFSMIIFDLSCAAPREGAKTSTWSARSGLHGRNISRERDHVVMRELFNNRRHQGARASLPRMLLEVVQLTHQIARRTSGDPGNCIHAFEVGAMAGRTGDGCVRSAGFGQALALCKAALGHVDHELRASVTMFE